MKMLYRYLPLVLLAVLWEVVARLELVSSSALPPLSDVIVSWNGQALRGVRALVRALGPDSVGATAELSLRRGGEPVTAKLTIGERPAA